MKIKLGMLCRVIGGTDNLNVGKIVKVTSFEGEHSKLGNIWRCNTQGKFLVTEYGGVGISADFAEDWLEPIDEPPTANSQYSHRNDPVYNDRLAAYHA